jgi:cell division transport system permease protein
MPSTEARAYPAYDLRRTNRIGGRTSPAPAAPYEHLRDMPEAIERRQPAERVTVDIAPRVLAPIIPLQSIAGRSLLAIIAIMSFLAAMTLGAVVLVRTAAGEWQAQVSRELTIQVRPVAGRDLEADVALAADIAQATPGVASVRVYSKEESGRLLEPWLGSGLALDALPIPRLIVVGVAPNAVPDLRRLRADLAAQVTSASVDDHRAWVDRMQAMTRAAILMGMGILGLMLAATILLVTFATRGAMASNRAIVEVLHFVGAKNRYIAGQFQRHFLTLGLKGACLGGGFAVALFVLARIFGGGLKGTAGEQEVEALFGNLALGPEGYAGILGVLVLVAAITAITSRFTVHRTLNTLE